MRRSSLSLLVNLLLCISVYARAETRTGVLAANTIPQSTFLAVAQPGNSITGNVFDEKRNPIPDVYLELFSDMGSPLKRTKASAVGSYSFRGLGDGVFVVKVLPYGTDFVQQEKRINLMSISARPGFGGANEQVDFYLQPRRSPVNSTNGSPIVVFVQEIPKKAEDLYLEGIALLGNKRSSEAHAKLRESIEVFPTYFAALDRLASEYVLINEYRAAFVLFTAALNVNPKSYSSWFGLGVCQFRLKLVSESLISLRRANELQPETVTGLLWLGIALHSNGQLGDALDTLKKADRLEEGELSDINFQMARVLKDQGKYREAAEQLEIVLAKNPKVENADELKKMIALLKAKR